MFYFDEVVFLDFTLYIVLGMQFINTIELFKKSIWKNSLNGRKYRNKDRGIDVIYILL